MNNAGYFSNLLGICRIGGAREDNTTYFRGLFAFALILQSALASGQDGSTFMSGLAVENTNTIITGNMQNNAMQATLEKDKKPKKATPPANKVQLTYTPSPARTRQNMNNFLAKASQANPAGAEEIRRVFARNDIMGAIRTAMTRKGLSMYNVADAYAVYWIISWQASRGDFTDYPSATYQAVAAQAARAIGSTASFLRLNDAQKQELAEMMLMNAVVIEGTQSAARGKPDQLQQVAQMARKNAANFGLNLDGIILTPHGFASAKQPGRRR